MALQDENAAVVHGEGASGAIIERVARTGLDLRQDRTTEDGEHWRITGDRR